MIGRFIKPEIVVSHFHIREGDLVADFGSGCGYFATILSKRVGSEGRVFLCEIQKKLVQTCEALTQDNDLNNVEVIWSNVEREKGTKIEDEILDVGLLINTLFLFEDKEAALKEIHRTLRPGGKFFVIDWSESFGGLGPGPGAIIQKQEAIDITEAAGFVLEREFDAGDHHYGLAFRKP